MGSQRILLEIIGFDLEGVITAAHRGADRIELCADPALGGTTPSVVFLQQARDIVSLPIYAMVRPRGGNFLYTTQEFDQMMESVALCKAIGIDGIVFGILDEQGNVDVKRCGEIISQKGYLGATFHRAFDVAADPFDAAVAIEQLKFERILTSGQAPTAIEGRDLLASLIGEYDEKLCIMPGSGITADNVEEIVTTTHCKQVHASAKKIDANGNYAGVSMEEVQGLRAVLDRLA